MANRTPIENFYLTNHDFQVYVNKNSQAYGTTLEQELQNPITIEYYKSLLQGGCNAKREDRRTDS